MLLVANCNKRKCKYFIGVKQPDNTEMSERVVCEAYPDGIPNDIAYGDDKHFKVRKDQDNEIVFKKK